MTYRRATTNDCPRLAELNHQLIRDEGHRNRMTVPQWMKSGQALRAR
jgi:hypothetical protein